MSCLCVSIVFLKIVHWLPEVSYRKSEHEEEHEEGGWDNQGGDCGESAYDQSSTLVGLGRLETAWYKDLTE